jgi:hypothetical protein
MEDMGIGWLGSLRQEGSGREEVLTVEGAGRRRWMTGENGVGGIRIRKNSKRGGENQVDNMVHRSSGNGREEKMESKE